MGALKKAWAAISHAFTLQALLLFLFPTGIIVGLAIWLSTLTTLIRLFAPLSYLVVVLVVSILMLTISYGAIGIAKQLGWKPKRRARRPRLPRRNAALAEVFRYVSKESSFAIANVTPQTAVQVILNELMDRITEEDLAVWGRIADLPIQQISPADLPYCRIDAGSMTIRRTGEWGTTTFTDVQLNWQQVRRTWPKPTWWRTLASRLNRGVTNAPA